MYKGKKNPSGFFFCLLLTTSPLLLPQKVTFTVHLTRCILHSTMPKKPQENGVERVILKLPKSIAAYFRSAFPHGKRSEFVAHCIMNHKHAEEVASIERELKKVAKKRQ